MRIPPWVEKVWHEMKGSGAERDPVRALGLARHGQRERLRSNDRDRTIARLAVEAGRRSERVRSRSDEGGLWPVRGEKAAERAEK